MLKTLNKIVVAIHTFLLLGMSYIMLSRDEIEELSIKLFPDSELLMNSIIADNLITYYALVIPVGILISLVSVHKKELTIRKKLTINIATFVTSTVLTTFLVSNLYPISS
ncbi:hypothetical protein [Photobacterium sanguinicancri]|uniref:hypothetical protein n=1 Tax=Photobacterium sanguinicancri TaxID=875932 RepID=UPI0026E130DC|nr:hypothetical protein [Photobacterium sanguinicancri]MDO6501170.1 hypothetical protein [Photobacterium sanguinicancri]